MRLSLNGRTLNVAEPPRTGSEKRPSLLFVHGAGCDVSVWQAQADFFAGRHPAYRLDLPGHGGSTPVGEECISSYATWVRLAAASLFATEPFVLVGHSMGGAVALELAAAPPEALAGVVLVGTGARLGVTRAIFQMLTQDPEAFFQSVGLFAFSPATRTGVRERVVRAVKRCPLPVILGDFKACDAFDMRGRLGAVRIPALILSGLDDQLTPAAYASYLRDAIFDSRLVMVPEAGHMVMAERPEAVNQAIAQFLAEL